MKKKYLSDFLFSDPLKFPRRYTSFKDREVSALISALLAYGRVNSIERFLEKMHLFLGIYPYEGILENKFWNKGGYRFQKESDIRKFLFALSKIIRDYETLENLFSSFNGTAEEKLVGFVQTFRKIVNVTTFGLDHLLSLPSKTSPAKRWRLFLRWVVREDDGLDLGLWKVVKPSDLIIPLDTHIAKVAIELNLTQRKTKDFKFAFEVTQKLKEICPEDPLKYDFALVREGILKNYFKGGKIDESN